MKRYMTTREAAEYIGYAKSTLEKWRSVGGGPRYSQPTPQSVRYCVEDLDAFMEANKFRNTSEASEARR